MERARAFFIRQNFDEVGCRWIDGLALGATVSNAIEVVYFMLLYALTSVKIDEFHANLNRLNESSLRSTMRSGA